MLLKRSGSRHLIRESLKSGKVVVMACDTIYGFMGKVPDTEEVIRSIKGRGENSPFLQLVSDTASLKRAGAILPDTEILKLWPGPFTFVLSLKGGGTAAYRIPEDESLRQLIREVGAPLYSTSVNRSGKPSMNNPVEIEKEFGDEVSLIEDSGIFQDRLPSTVVDLTGSTARILRQGAGTVPPEYLKHS